MKYLLLLYDDPEATDALGAEARRAIVDEHITYTRMLTQRGVHLFSEPLGGPESARTIRFDGEVPVVTDGPFLETKEALGGFYVIDCGSLEEAVELAGRVPRSPGLVAELRTIPEV